MEAYLLLFSILLPWLAAGILLIGPRWPQTAVRIVSLLGFAFPAAVACILVQDTAAFADGGTFFVKSWDTGLSHLGISLKLGLNGLSLPLYVMASIVGLAAGAHAAFSNLERLRFYNALLLIMHGGLMGVFCTLDVFFFYLMHEVALIASFLMIGIWGGAWRKRTAIEVTLYLSAGAMLTLVGLIALYVQSGAESFDLETLQTVIAQTPLQATAQKYIFGLLALGLGILVSLFPFHSWAPRGYNAMPTSTAMLHAGVLKKFGLFGLLQIAYPLLDQGALYATPWIVTLALGNIFIIGLITLAQEDLKLMIGYSSVMHMGYAFLGLACLSTLGIQGTILMIFAHGLSVSLLFLLADYIQKRTQSYSFADMGGMGPQTPWLSGLFIAATFAGIGLPGFANFWGELALFTALWHAMPWACALATFGIVLSAVYGLRACARIFMGPPIRDLPLQDLSPLERLPALLLLSALLTFGLCPKLLSDPLHHAFSQKQSAGPPAGRDAPLHP